MGTDPNVSVVNANCRVHGYANLYIGSSAVFPTGGFSNPTLTVIALCLRIADELKQRLAHSSLMTLIPNWDYVVSVKYRGSKGKLLYSHQIYTRDGLPSPEVFQNQLALLKKLESITKQVNEAPNAGNKLNR